MRGRKGRPAKLPPRIAAWENLRQREMAMAISQIHRNDHFRSITMPEMTVYENLISNKAPQQVARCAHAFAADRDRVAGRDRCARLPPGFRHAGPSGPLPGQRRWRCRARIAATRPTRPPLRTGFRALADLAPPRTPHVVPLVARLMQAPVDGSSRPTAAVPSARNTADSRSIATLFWPGSGSLALPMPGRSTQAIGLGAAAEIGPTISSPAGDLAICC